MLQRLWSLLAEKAHIQILQLPKLEGLKINFYTPNKNQSKSLLKNIATTGKNTLNTFTKIKNLNLQSYVLYDEKDAVYLTEKFVSLKELNLHLYFNINFIIKKYDPRKMSIPFSTIAEIHHCHFNAFLTKSSSETHQVNYQIIDKDKVPCFGVLHHVGSFC